MVIIQLSSPTSWTKTCLFSSNNTLSSRISRKGIENGCFKFMFFLQHRPSKIYNCVRYSHLKNVSIANSILARNFMEEHRWAHYQNHTRSIQLQIVLNHLDYTLGGWHLYSIPFICLDDIARHVHVHTWFGHVQGYVFVTMVHPAGVDLPR